MPVVTTMTAPTTGRATGSTSPMIPVSELATDVKLVTNAVDTLSICVSPFFCALRFFDYIYQPVDGYPDYHWKTTEDKAYWD